MIFESETEGKKSVLIREIAERRDQVYGYLCSEEYRQRFSPAHIREAVYSYIKSGGKSLRPAVLLFSCGAVGGDEARALPAAAAIEVYHTWTLVHDDVIDRDKKRRGHPTVHQEFREKAERELRYSPGEAQHYGLSMAILAGDIQQGWAASLLCELHRKQGIDPDLVLYLIEELSMRVQSSLLEGEMLDIQYSKHPIESLGEDLIVDMLWKKTGALYEFAGKAGAMIGLNVCDPEHKLVRAISAFTSKCGTAFQLQDDILGIVGDEELLGKSIGSDIREGKRTTIVYYAFKNASDRQKDRLISILSNEQATENNIEEATNLLRSLGGIDYTRALARSYLEDALAHLGELPASRYSHLLSLWAEYMIEREF